MKKNLTFDHSVRCTYKDQFVCFVRTDASVKLDKDVKVITANHQEQMGSLLLGDVVDVDLDNASKRFFMATAHPSEDKAEFLGYIDTKQPAKAEVLLKLWPKLTFKPVEPEAKPAS